MKYILLALALILSTLSGAATLTYTDTNGSVSCVTDTQPTQPPVTPPIVPPVVPPTGDLCAKYGITNNTEATRIGNTSKWLNLTPGQAYSFSFTTGGAGEGSTASTNYSTVKQYMSISKNKCDFDLALESKLCAQQGYTGPSMYVQVGGTSTWRCVLEPNTTYYLNVRDAVRDPVTHQLTETCDGNCPFMVF